MSPKIATELAEIQAQNGGVLLPARVVAYARNPATALHGQFEWDDSEAAEKWRLEQARQVIRLHVTIISEEADPVRAYVSLTTDRAEGGGYRSVVDVLADPALSDQMLRDALMELHAMQRRFERVRALKPIWEALSRVTSAGADPEPMQATG